MLLVISTPKPAGPGLPRAPPSQWAVIHGLFGSVVEAEAKRLGVRERGAVVTWRV